MTRKEVLNAIINQQESYHLYQCSIRSVFKSSLVDPNNHHQTPTETEPRSYTVETKHTAHYQRNRRFIQPAEKTPPPGDTTNSVIPSSNSLEQPR